jgi:hypothetical protein
MMWIFQIHVKFSSNGSEPAVMEFTYVKCLGQFANECANVNFNNCEINFYGPGTRFSADLKTD